MTLHRQIPSQLGKIVDFAVVGDPDSSIFVAHRHVPGSGKINNGESPASQADIGTVGKFLLPHSCVVGPAMSLHVSHASECFMVSPVNQSADTTHLVKHSSVRSRFVDGGRSAMVPTTHASIEGHQFCAMT